MQIEIVNWEKFNPRKDLKSMAWLRVSSKIGIEPKLFGLDPGQKWLWVFLLSTAAQDNKAVLELEADYLAHYVEIPTAKVIEALDIFHKRGLIKILTNESVTNPIESVTTRQVEVTSRYENETYERNGRTDGTNGTDGRNERVADVRSANAAVPDLVLEPEPPKKTRAPPGPQTPTGKTWDAYRQAYKARYGTEPKSNAKQMGMCKKLVERLGAEDAPKVVAFYLTHDKAYYVGRLHALDCCVWDAEPLMTQMTANYRVSNTEAQRADKGQSNAQVFARVAAKLKAEEDAKREQQ